MKDWRTPSGGRIDRSRPVQFRFDARTYSGYAGDTLASALLANGVALVGRSFKYHRPRGILGAGAEEPNALVEIVRDENRRTPNVRATQVEIYPGLIARSQNRWPNLSFDVGAAGNLLSPLFPAGFYYKTFMWPRSAWHRLYEPQIRRAAGLGRAPAGADPDRYAHRYAHCEVLVVGAGPAGLAAALAAARAGARVMLCDEQCELGGSLLAAPACRIEGLAGADWLARTLRELNALAPQVTLLPRTTAFGYFPHNNIGLAQRLTDHLASPDAELPRERLWQVRAREVVLATGAIERPLVFPGNDRPGVMLASAARTYLHRYGVRVGARIVVLAGSDGAYGAALDLHAAGAAIAAIVDVRDEMPGTLQDTANSAGIAVIAGATVLGTSGRLRVRRILVAQDVHGKATSSQRWLDCDAVLMSGGMTPTVHLFSQSRGQLSWNESLAAFIPAQPAERTRNAGACTAEFGLAAALASGADAGASAASAAGFAGSTSRFRTEAREWNPVGRPGDLPHSGEQPPAKAFVDFQNDVTTRDLALAMREGFESIEHIKRYTTTGMATDQGKTSNVNALAVAAAGLERPLPKVGLTTFRMPYTPTSFGCFAVYDRGDLFDPVRKTPTHDWAAAHGAVFEDVGLWKRARYFAHAGEDMHAAVARECKAVRLTCGIFDASTLGKIEVAGPDAAEFLNRLYVNNWSNLAPGKSRYGLLLRDDGFIFDDGVIARLEPDRFHVTTTTGGAARVFELMEDYRQTEWPDLKVWITSTTEQWAVIAVQGPRARDVVASIISELDISNAAFPHMSVGKARIDHVPALLFRVSFTGELGYEINVPANYGEAAWTSVLVAGEAKGITAYGTEAMHVMRAEKGYIIVGQETDGTVTPDDAGLSWAIGKNKPDFLGKRSLARPAMRANGRKQLVGLLTDDPKVVLDEGAQLVERPGLKAPMPMIGHVTSSYASPVLDRSIALAMVLDGRARQGQTLYVPMPGGDIPVKVSAPVFYDPEGKRIHG